MEGEKFNYNKNNLSEIKEEFSDLDKIMTQSNDTIEDHKTKML